MCTWPNSENNIRLSQAIVVYRPSFHSQISFCNLFNSSQNAWLCYIIRILQDYPLRMESIAYMNGPTELESP